MAANAFQLFCRFLIALQSKERVLPSKAPAHSADAKLIKKKRTLPPTESDHPAAAVEAIGSDTETGDNHAFSNAHSEVLG